VTTHRSGATGVTDCDSIKSIVCRPRIMLSTYRLIPSSVEWTPRPSTPRCATRKITQGFGVGIFPRAILLLCGRTQTTANLLRTPLPASSARNPPLSQIRWRNPTFHFQPSPGKAPTIFRDLFRMSESFAACADNGWSRGLVYCRHDPPGISHTPIFSLQPSHHPSCSVARDFTCLL